MQIVLISVNGMEISIVFNVHNTKAIWILSSSEPYLLWCNILFSDIKF